MKKKGLVVTLSAIGVVLTLILVFFAVVVFSGNQITIARCIVTENDSLYMVYDDRPVKLSYGGDKYYEIGDKLLIIHQSAFAESYPEQTRAIYIIKIGSGSIEDIPQKTLDVLIETGNWK